MLEFGWESVPNQESGAVAKNVGVLTYLGLFVGTAIGSFGGAGILHTSKICAEVQTRSLDFHRAPHK
jgi:hypothetical protein